MANQQDPMTSVIDHYFSGLEKMLEIQRTMLGLFNPVQTFEETAPGSAPVPKRERVELLLGRAVGDPLDIGPMPGRVEDTVGPVALRRSPSR